jgi:uncharacterized membrane protein SpoIIM required for sporulation
MGEEAYCADCLAWLHQHGPASRVVHAFLVLEIAGLVFLPVCLLKLVLPAQLLVGAAGLWVSTRELRRIREGEGSLQGAKQAKVVRMLAWVNLLLGVMSVVGLLFLRLRFSQR